MERLSPINPEKVKLALLLGWAVLALPYNLIKDELAFRNLPEPENGN